MYDASIPQEQVKKEGAEKKRKQSMDRKISNHVGIS